ncbi:MAG: SxtJ family membrane protein [Acidobacteria bacterium]|nr:SxtJ family membrane protein [Acidobacteriota bacterium]
MQSQQKTPKTSFREEREFGLIVGSALILLGSWWLYHDKWRLVATSFLAVGLALLLLGSLSPRALVFPNRAWMALARLLSSITTPIILGIIYFGVFMPIGVVKRLFGWDPLRRRAFPADSYWSPYNARQRDSHHFEKMY